VDAAKQAVADQLPYYCTPKFIIDLAELPKTPRGKIDKRLLLEMAKAYDAVQENLPEVSAPDKIYTTNLREVEEIETAENPPSPQPSSRPCQGEG
jgi:hypothetical protein